MPTARYQHKIEHAAITGEKQNSNFLKNITCTTGDGQLPKKWSVSYNELKGKRQAKLHKGAKVKQKSYFFLDLCSVVVKALSYKPEGRGFDTRWGEFLNLPNPSGHIRP
jgi:hypothetical protein